MKAKDAMIQNRVFTRADLGEQGFWCESMGTSSTRSEPRFSVRKRDMGADLPGRLDRYASNAVTADCVDRERAPGVNAVAARGRVLLVRPQGVYAFNGRRAAVWTVPTSDIGPRVLMTDGATSWSLLERVTPKELH